MVLAVAAAPGRQARVSRTRFRWVCRGVVQGVGFRPAVHRLASSLGLSGWVRNTPEGVVIEVEGARRVVEGFGEALASALPPLARLGEVTGEEVAPGGGEGFQVLASEEGVRRRALVPPDTALCADCRADMANPADRRFHYPFTTCTNCGPRFTLVRSLPYDRERTSMACFPLCPACRREYEDPSDRRFHAEPVCCPACGPRLWLVHPRQGAQTAYGPPWPTGTDALAAAQRALAQGETVAVKGMGGFQLACLAGDAAVVARLRERKHRPSKPFAVMVRDLERARALAVLSQADEALLASARAPVVLVRRRSDAPVAAGVAPGLDDVGVMLPTTPLHEELLRGAPFAELVMTSGNRSDEPICRGNREALERLAGIADAFLLHDRDVVRRADDSVARSTRAGPVMVRRARGYVPESLPLPDAAAEPVLALGPFLQVTACLAVGGEAFCSQHVGDLDSEAARAFLAEVVLELEEFLQASARVVVVDEHPDYPSTWLGERLVQERGGRLIVVQHHVAHAAAVLAEHGRFPALGERCAALALDGTGWGGDGTAWGGEWLELGGDLTWGRLARLQPLPLVGGEAAVRQPWRVAAAALARLGEEELLASTPLARLIPAESIAAAARLARSEHAWPLASGAGRLFEAAGALLGLAVENRYEGEAAARLEACAADAPDRASWPEVALARSELPSAELLAAAARRLADGESPAAVAYGVHATFARLAADLTARVVPQRLRLVAVGGGCLVNRLLRDLLRGELDGHGFEVLLPQALPPGDGGLSYGQVVLAAVALARGRALRRKGGDE